MLRSRFSIVLVALASLSSGCGGDDFRSSGDVGTTPDAALDASGDASPDTAADTAADTSADTVTEALEDGHGDVAVEVDGSEAGKLLAGEACLADDECESDVCSEGVCCETQCETCWTCRAPGKTGQCTPVVEGQNPGEACGQTGEPCSGACDGLGNCSYPNGDVCGDVACHTNGLDVLTPRCDGAGQCRLQTDSCSPFVCEGAGCLVSCTEGPEACAPGFYCDGDACLGKQGLGDPCDIDAMCTSEHCADGVCCDDACDGTCETCAASGQEGVCLPIPEETDPALECAGSNSLCAGTCDGHRACHFPDASQPCGPSTCHATENVEVVQMCNGAGGCEESQKDCGLYDCESVVGACLASCSGHDACIDSAYCQASTCHAKMPDASVCQQPYECSSGYCEQTVSQKRCCNTACPAPMDCATGVCLCQGVTCATGVSCVPWYRDLDQDTYGDPASMTMGCENAPPKDVNGKDYVRNMDDCYDLSLAARPGQTGWFQEHRGDGSFDYDCDKAETKEFNDTLASTATCKDCRSYALCTTCGNPLFRTYGYTCKVPSGFDNTCGPIVIKSFKQARPCGQTGTLFACNHGDGVCSSVELTTPNTTQRCR
jgi:hypothetical protein